MSWEEYSIQELCSRVTDGAHYSPIELAGGFPMASSKDMMENDFDLSNVKTISEADYNKLVDADCKPLLDDILIIKDGNSYLKYIFRVKEERELVVLSSIAILRPNKDRIDPQFFQYALRNPTAKKQMENFVSGAAIPRIVLKDFKLMRIPPPPLPTQRRIATILSAYDDLIENNLKRIRLLEEAAQNIYREWFVNFRFTGHERVQRSADGLPEGWQVKKLKDVCATITYGFTASANQEKVGPKFLRITDIVPMVIDWSSVPFCEISEDKIPQFELQNGDIVVARTGATVGYAKRINKRHERAIFASYLVRLRPKKIVENRMIGLFVESEIYKQYINSNVSGAAQPNANAQTMANVNIPIPPKEIQDLFKNKVEPIIDQKEVLQLYNERLREARDILLPRLMNRNIEV